MYDKIYTCICGRTFETANSFNGHKSHCVKHQVTKHGSTEFYDSVQLKRSTKISQTLLQQSSEKRNSILQKWVSEKHTCEKCGKVMTNKYGSGRFCSQSCANSNKHSSETKKKIKNTIDTVVNSPTNRSIRYEKAKNTYLQSPVLCKVCGKVLPFELRSRKLCDDINCKKILWKQVGLKSAEVQSERRRSKNEILFCSLCEDSFNNVKHNEQLFNGWDADVIIEDIKYAILWNGPWHYVKITKAHSVEQVQTRDRIKTENIIKCGYTPYVVKDLGEFDPAFVNQAFETFLNEVNNLR